MQSKGFQTGLLFVAMILSAMVIANLPYRYVSRDVTRTGSLVLSPTRYQMLDEMPTMAGWPMRFAISYQDDRAGADHPEVYRYWSTLKLVGNIVLLGSTSVFVFFFIRYRERKLAASARPRRTQAIFDSVFAISIVAIPASIMGFIFWDQRQDSVLLSQLSTRFNRVDSCWLPDLVADQIPQAIRPLFSKIRLFQAVEMTSEDLAKVAQLDSLVTFESVSGKFDEQELSQLNQHVHLNSLRLGRHSLSSEDIDIIATLPYLRQLSLGGSSFSNTSLARLNKYRGLTHVDLNYTPIKLSELGKPEWSQSVRHLQLPRPLSPQADSLTLKDWPHLVDLSVNGMPHRFNDQVLSIDLENLPKLRHLRLDRVQKYALRLVNLPVLRNIDDLVDLFDTFAGNYSKEEWMPSMMWLASLQMDRLKSLKKISFFGGDLQQVEFGDLSNLQDLTIGAFSVSTLGGIEQTTMDDDVRQKLLQLIGTKPGPDQISFSAIPMLGADISPLAQNSGIRSLRFRGTPITFKQLKTLKGMDGLASLGIGLCELKNDDLGWLLQHFENLEQLTADTSGLTKLEVTESYRLNQLVCTPIVDAEVVKIVNQPQLFTELRFVNTPKEFLISNVPKIRGIAMEHPWTADCKIDGLRDLEWFAAGGRALNDSVLNELMVCPNLSHLTLAYPTLSPDALRDIGELESLTVLSLPGANVDDEITQSWRGLNGLWEINLDDNPIGVGTLAWMSKNRLMRTASLNRIELDGAAMSAISELTQVTSLSLSGTDVNADAMRPLLRNDALESLDLSGNVVTQAMLTELEDNRSLKFLNLAGCELSDSQITKLEKSNKKLKVNTDPNSKGRRLLSTEMVAMEILRWHGASQEEDRRLERRNQTDRRTDDEKPQPLGQVNIDDESELKPDQGRVLAEQRPSRFESHPRPERGQIDVRVFRDTQN